MHSSESAFKPAINDGQRIGRRTPNGDPAQQNIGDKSMKIPHAPSFRRTRLASACGLLLAGVTVAHAQGAAPAGTPASGAAGDRSDVQSVTVTGIRASLDTSMALKRDAHGIVDGITAEDVGKFPDTNLAEAMQRISGVSIDRAAGEGAKITVRGFGPDYNMILLNGRQLPTSTVLATGASTSRAFDFANLASESISSLEVWKTSKVSQPAGGIGATINIKTARPLEQHGRVASIGVKAGYDQANDRLPADDKSSKLTPEISGIYSDAFANRTIGVSLTGSYQVHDGGYNQASTSGYHTFLGSTNDWGTIPQPGAAGSENITNRPCQTCLYQVPQSIDYSVNGIKRQRTNGQLTLQWQPAQAFTSTLDYTFSQNVVKTKASDLSSWFNFGPSVSSWTSGPVAGPLLYSETLNGTSDIAMGGNWSAIKTTLRSLGLNLAWKPSPTLRFEADGHSSNSTSGSDSPYGTNSDLGTATFHRGTTTVDFTHPFPVMSIVGEPSAADNLVTGSSFRNSYMKSNISQLQLKGSWDMNETSALDFGVNVTHVKNRTAYGNVDQGSWGGATTAADYPDSVWHPTTLSKYFNRMSGSNNPAVFQDWFTFNFPQVDSIAASVGDPTHYVAPSKFTTDIRTKENTTSLFGQYNWDGELWHRPTNLTAGLRYEKTDVTSSGLVQIPIPGAGLDWTSNNELYPQYGPTNDFTTLKGSYHYLLPAVDFDTEVVRDVKLRLSYGDTIARPTYDQIQGGLALASPVRSNGGTGNVGDPGLKPLRSHNLDASLEWYYGKSSFASVGFFHKNVSNYIGTSINNSTPYNIPTPIGGAYYTAAEGACASSDVTCIRNYIFAHYNGQPGVNQTGTDSLGNATGSIKGQPGDPITNFAITVPVNAHNASLHGFEFNVQNPFGNTGLGVAANYTLVVSGLKYDNDSVGQQFALVGLSNTANVVAFYENEKVNARLAYNWRGQFLQSTQDGQGYNPVYVEPYHQIDATLGYNYNDHLSFTLDALNLNDGVIRSHSRTTEAVESIVQTGRRFLLGARYKF
jgi:TonB-dependent receptor